MYAFVILLSGFYFSYIDRVSKLHVPTFNRKGAQTKYKIDSGGYLLLGLLYGLYKEDVNRVSADFYDTGRWVQVGRR